MTRPEIVIAAALEEWKRHVEEPPGKGWGRIVDYIHEGLGWRRQFKSKAYRNRSFEWCGAFAAHCYRIAGLSLKVRKSRLASCYRLWKWSGKTKPNARRIEPHSIEPGDIVVVGPEITGGRTRWGKHICIAYKPSADGWQTIEGNAHGSLASGYGEGVVRQERPFGASNPRTYRILYGVRPLECDYI